VSEIEQDIVENLQFFDTPWAPSTQQPTLQLSQIDGLSGDLIRFCKKVLYLLIAQVRHRQRDRQTEVRQTEKRFQ